jgi:serine kinase of HPr protein (carbohydrate metabolism regulator)
VSFETIHASCVAIGGRGVLIAGASGTGKSDLALRLIDRGAALVSDDYTHLAKEGGRLVAAAPAALAGKIEVRGIGIVSMESATDVPICLLVDLSAAPERMPEPESRLVAGCQVPAIALAALEPSAPLKLETALHRFGLSLP